MSGTTPPAAAPAPAAPTKGDRSPITRRRIWNAIAVPLVVIVGSLALGAIVVLFSELLVPGKPFDPWLWVTAYAALVEGATGSYDAVVSTLVNTTPLLLGGLAVGFGFKAGLFNIGAQGQFLIGALGSVIVGVWVSTWSPILAIPAATIAGILAGAFWGFIPGFLKAVSGAHEVVSTIMMNYIAVATLAALVSGPLKVPRSPQAMTFDVKNAAFPVFLGRNGHIGILIALLAALFVWWLLNRTTWGFEVRSVGANPDASRYAGMRPRLIIIATMTFSGALAGLAGTSVLLGVNHAMTSSFGTTVGFDSIAVALLARSNPLGIIFSALIFGAMRAGAGLMQVKAQIPAELVDVLQATILLLLVATPVIRRVFGLSNKARGLQEPVTPMGGGAVV